MNERYVVRADDLRPIIGEAEVSQGHPGRDITTSVRVPEALHLAVRRLLMDETRGGTLQAFFVGAAKAAIADPKIAKRVLAEMPKRGER